MGMREGMGECVWVFGNEGRCVSVWGWGKVCECLGMREGVWVFRNEGRYGGRCVSVWEWGKVCDSLEISRCDGAGIGISGIMTSSPDTVNTTLPIIQCCQIIPPPPYHTPDSAPVRRKMHLTMHSIMHLMETKRLIIMHMQMYYGDILSVYAYCHRMAIVQLKFLVITTSSVLWSICFQNWDRTDSDFSEV